MPKLKVAVLFVEVMIDGYIEGGGSSCKGDT